jgi:hypothetical protein
LTTEFRELGRDGRSGAVDVEDAVAVGAEALAAAVGVVELAVIADEAVGVAADDVAKAGDPAAAPALSHGLGGETDAMDMREGFGTSAISHGDGPHRGGQSEREREKAEIARQKD